MGWAVLFLSLASTAQAAVITRLPGKARVIALTLDACEGPTRAALDHPIVSYLHEQAVPFTVFMGGRFARDNAEAVRALAGDVNVEIENHSFSHLQDMRKLTDEQIRAEVDRAQAIIKSITGRTTRLFRFPAGRTDERTTAVVEAMGYKVVHWRFASGDPDPALSAASILSDTLSRVRAGDVLIFHINGRGVHTLEVLSELIPTLRQRGYSFMRLDQVL